MFVINVVLDRVHPNFHQYGAESGRLSCDHPNLQQIPRDTRFRSCFIPAEGCKFIIADFSQIELRVAADIAKDKTMIEAYQNGEDLHRLTASLVTGKPLDQINREDRQIAKAVNFGLIYGMSLWKFRDYAESSYGVKLTEDEASQFYHSYFEHYEGITAWHEKVKRERLLETRTRSNRRAIFENYYFSKSLNYPIQGTSVDITKESLAQLPSLLKPIGGRIAMCVHDEIIVEIKEDAAEQALKMLVETMESAGNKYLTSVPCIVEAKIGDSWATK